MRNKTIRALSALLALLMLALAVAACAQTDDGADATTAAAEVETKPKGEKEVETDKYDIGDHLLDKYDFGKETIVIASRGRQWTADEVAVESEMGDTINDAIYKRNVEVEKRLNILIDNYLMTPGTDNYEIATMIESQIGAGLDDYDLVCASAYASIISTSKNIFYNLTDLEALDLSQPYWSQSFNEAASFGNSQTMCSGAICLSFYRFIFATFFNRQMFDAASEPYLYTPVRDHQWTLEYQFNLAQKFYSDVNGDQKADIDDVYGFVSNDYIGVDPYWSACKLPIMEKDADNYFRYAVDIERTNEAVVSINKLFWNNPGTFVIAHASADSEQEAIAAKFASGTAAMCTLRLIEVEGNSLRNMVDDYGIVPMPMLNTNQDNYYSYAHDTMSAYAVPNTNKKDDDFQRIGIVLEAMGSASYKHLVPEYYEVALKSKYCNDPESIEMLDLITQNVYFDPGVLYTKLIGSVHQEMRNFIGQKMATAVPKLTALQKTGATEKLIATLNEELLEVDN